MPDESIPFPYGLKNSRASESSLIQPLRAHLTILLGASDVDPEDPRLRKDARAMALGENRFERGLHFFGEARDLAKTRNTDFSWQVKTVPNVAHDFKKMSPIAAEILLKLP